MSKKKVENETNKTPKTPSTDDNKEQKPSRDANGRFQKGHKKEGGRVAGTPNRASNIRDRLKEQVEPFVGQIGELLIKVQKEEGTNEMLQRLEKFMPYFMPRYSSMALSADQNRPISEEQRLLELDAMYTKKELAINFKTMTVVDNSKQKDPTDDEDDFDISQFDVVDNG